MRLSTFCGLYRDTEQYLPEVSPAESRKVNSAVSHKSSFCIIYQRLVLLFLTKVTSAASKKITFQYLTKLNSVESTKG
jgi:hypothetical protein